MRRALMVLLCLLLLAGVWYFWPSNGHPVAPNKTAAKPVSIDSAVTAAASPAASTNHLAVSASQVGRSAASTNRVNFRLTNTAKTLAEMTTSPHAILLENALVDTSMGLSLNIPKQLQSTGDPGAYIVQARGPVSEPFRAALVAAGVSPSAFNNYIPNNAYLVQLTSAAANGLAANPLVQAVLPYEPYFKVQSSLLGLALQQKPLPSGQVLTLGLFPNEEDAAVAQIRKLDGEIVARDNSPFGPVLRVLPTTANWVALARLPMVQRVEPATHRELANDLARVVMGISTDTVTNVNWLGLSGSNVLVEVNDTGIDPTHPDFNVTGSAENPGPDPANPSRVTGYDALSLLDVDGHGTHVAGIIAGNGSESYSVTNTPQGSVTNADFRGKAPAANLFAFGFLGANDVDPYSDELLQSIPALTNALISNNSWVNSGANEYDLSAASYDAAVRDALPYQTGPQPVLFVFAAGNDGSGNDNGGAGNADSILSPATAKNVVTVGALEQYRNITNEVALPDGTTNAIWQGETDSSSEVAAYSARGNVGIQTEGDHGRFKPDVVAPGTFVVSTRSRDIDLAAYYNPTNYDDTYSEPGLTMAPGDVLHGGGTIPPNAVGLTIHVEPNRFSPKPFPTNIPIYFATTGLASPSNYVFMTSNNALSIPPGGGGITDIVPLQNQGFSCAVANPTNYTINFDLIITIAVTNKNGDELTVLSNLNETLAPWYIYDTGTSMAAPAVSGALALMQDYFTNTLHTTPSPALLKAMLINGARPTAGYDYFAVTNNINYEGWGLVNVPNSVPLGLTNVADGTTLGSMFFVDQSPTNTLATGDRRTYHVTVPSLPAQNENLRITLAWTDPPGNPAAAIKLVNNLDLVVSNWDTGHVYYGNDFIGTTSVQVNTNAATDSINNVENIWIPAPLGTNYDITVVGRNVAVNAVTTEQTNVVQDFALVVSCGDALNTNGITFAAATPSLTQTNSPLVTYVSSYTNGIYFDQLAGANAPWLSTNSLTIDPASVFGTNASLFIGQTNQWHFYVVTNTTTYSNAAFIIFLPNTLATPRIGVFADSTANSTRPEADLNLFAASEVGTPNGDPNASQLIALDPAVVSNCVYNVNGDQSSLGRGGTKFIAYSNSVGQQVYYIGVQCQDQMAAQFGFFAVFSEKPFSQMQNGKQIVNGLLVPAAIPDGSSLHPGVGYTVGLALYPMEVGGMTVSNTISHQNFGDLFGTLSHNGVNSVLNNHDGYVGTVTNYTIVYNDNGYVGTVAPDGPGTLRSFTGSQAIGPWFLTEVDDSSGQSGTINDFTMSIEPHQDLKHGPAIYVIPPHSWIYDYVDVPVGYTNLTVAGTNWTVEVLNSQVGQQPLELYVNEATEPTFADTNYMALLTNCVSGVFPTGTDPGNDVSVGPPITPDRYFVGVYNPNDTQQAVALWAYLAFDANAISRVNWNSTGPVPLVDDAVMTNSIFVTNTDIIQGINVGLRVDHPRISDLVFTLISPDGTRYLLMENRGGQSTEGAGVTVVSANDIANVTDLGSTNTSTNSFAVAQLSGTLPITWNFYTLPDQMTIYDNTNGNYGPGNLLFDTGMVSGSGQFNLPYSATSGLTIIMNQFGNTNAGSDQWTYTAGGVTTNYEYLTFTEDTNLTTTPIKYAVPPFVPDTFINSALANFVVWSNSFEESTLNGTETAGQYFSGGWLVDSGSVDTVPSGTFGSTAYSGAWWLDMNGNGPGQISTNVATVAGQSYILSFAYTRNPDTFPSVPSAQVLVDSNALLTVSPGYTNTWTSLDWQTTSVVFTATSPLTHLTFASLSPSQSGVLLDAISLATNNSSSTTDLSGIYYQPEQSIEPLIGTSAYGDWTLEVLDNRAGATNNANLVSWQLQFTFANTNIPPTPPVITQPASNITFTNAQLNALVYPAGDTNATLYFEYGTNWNGASLTSPQFSDSILLTSNLTSQQAYGILVTNLTPDTLYYFQAILTNSLGSNYYGGWLTFFSHSGQPYAATLPATLVTGTSAQLNGFATPNGLPSLAWFEWGTNMSYGNTTAPVDVGSGNSVVYTNALLSGLSNNIPYHFRLVVSNAFMVAYGIDQVLDEANVVAWGGNYLGQLNVPTNLTNAVAVAGAYDHSLSVKSDGTPVGWGDNTFGQATIPAAFKTNVTAAAGGVYYSMVLNSNSTVSAWGSALLNQTNVPVGLNGVVQIAGGAYSSLALRSDGSVVAWGATFFNLTNVPANASNIVAVSSGIYHNLALKNDGTVIAWGDSSAGQTNVPADVTNVVAIAAGGYHSLVLKADGTVEAWGDDSAGQTNIPPNLTNVVAIAAGGFHNMALQADGTLVMWGDNSSGQATVPTGLTNVVAIAAGYLHSLALTPQFLLNSTNVTVLDLTAGAPQTNNILPGDITYYQVNVPANADIATNTLIYAQNGPLNIWFSTNTPPTLSYTNATLLLGGATNGVSVLYTNSTPALVPGLTYYLGVQNTNTVTVNYAISVDFHLVTSTNTPPPGNTNIFISSIVYTTNSLGSNGFLLTWFAPTNDLFKVQWTDSLPPSSWNTFTNIVGYDLFISPTNSRFTFFDDGSQTGGFSPTRFYRLILLQSTNTISFVSPSNQTVVAGGTITVTNAATDSNLGATLTYTLLSAPSGAVIGSSDGVIVWTNAGPAGLAAQFNTLVTDDSLPPVSATNTFTVFVTPLPSITNVLVTATNVTLTWSAPTNDAFNVQWTTNLTPPVVWNVFPDTITSPVTGLFSFTDTNAPALMKFYQLILLP